MVALYWHVLRLFDIVDTFEDRETMTDAVDPHGFEIIVHQRHKSLTDDLIFLIVVR
jgi:hypothetical protein